MLDKIKNFFAAFASAGALLYAVGYISEYAHDRLLGLYLVEPENTYYLIKGGTFFIATLDTIFSTILRHPHFFLLPLGAIVVINLAAGKSPGQKKETGKEETAEPAPSSCRLSIPRLVLLSLVTLLIMFIVIPIFTAPFSIRDLLLTHSDKQPEPAGHFERFNAETRTWILNHSHVNRRNLAAMYVHSILWTVVTGLLFYFLLRFWRHCPSGKEDEAEPADDNAASLKKWLWAALARFRQIQPRCILGLLLLLTGIGTAVQTVSIPVNYGILIKSNFYPQVEVAAEPPVPVVANARAQGDDCTLWLLRENGEELLLYAAVHEKRSDNTVYKLFTVKREQVKTIELLDKRFIFEYK